MIFPYFMIIFELIEPFFQKMQLAMLLLRVAVIWICKTRVVLIEHQPFLKVFWVNLGSGFVSQSESLSFVIGLSQDITIPSKECISHFVDEALAVEGLHLDWQIGLRSDCIISLSLETILTSKLLEASQICLQASKYPSLLILENSLNSCIKPCLIPNPRVDGGKVMEFDNLLHAILLLLEVLWVSHYLKEHLRRIMVVKFVKRFR